MTSSCCFKTFPSHYLNWCSFIISKVFWYHAKVNLTTHIYIWHYVKLARSMMTSLIKWKHFPLYWPFVWGIHQSPVNSPHEGQWCETLMFSLICPWTNGWVNNRDAGDLRRHHDHYDVTVMTCGSLERTAIATSKSMVEWNIFRVQVGLGAGWVAMYFIWFTILL